MNQYKPAPMTLTMSHDQKIQAYKEMILHYEFLIEQENKRFESLKKK